MGQPASKQQSGRNNQSDSDLVCLARAGSRAAFSALVARHRTDIHKLALRLSDRAQDADDIVQETFMSAWLSITSFRGSARLRTWLYRIAINAAAMQRRAASRRHVQDVDALDVEDAADENRADGARVPHPDELIERKQSAELVHKAFERLPRYQRTLLALRYLEEGTNAEVAEILAISSESVRQRLVRARRNVREQLVELDPAA